MHPNLSFEQAPPFSVPMRFFVAAPWFGVVAGLLLAYIGGEVVSSRWTGEVLALTHLLGAGFLLHAMCGALLQFVPVAAGGNVWRPRMVAGVVQPLLGFGALMLAGGFFLAKPALLAGAATALLLGIVGFSAVMALALWRTPATGSTMLALRLAVIGLLVTGGLGATLAEGIARGWSLPFPALTDVHLVWALGGWALMLLAGVSYYVVPMFQLTPPYPAWAMRLFGPALFVLVLAWSGVQLIAGAEFLRRGVGVAGLLLAALFALLTLSVQARRRRRLIDATFLLFRLAMASLLCVAGLGLLMILVPVVGEDGRSGATLGILIFVGVFASAINGMLYKIVPFIAWLHLQRLGAPLTAMPNMKNIIPATAMTGQMRLHTLATGLLVLLPWLPALAVIAGLAFAASSAWLGGNLIGAVRRYAMFRDRIRAAGAYRES